MTIFKPGETAPLILIADDDPAIVRLLADRCSLMGFEVETASNGTQALRRVRQGGVDTLIIDVQMPDLDGLSISAYLLEYSRRPLHVIVVTGRRDAETVGTCDSMGAFYVRKARASGKISMLRWSRSTPQTRTASICRDHGRRAFPRRSLVVPVDDGLDAWLFMPRSGRGPTG